jgi:hypothetical protein
MTGLDPVIHENVAAREDVDGRIKSGHDEEGADIFAGDGDRPRDLQAECRICPPEDRRETAWVGSR